MSAATVVAKGKLTQNEDVNYLLMNSFQIIPPSKPAGDAKPKDKAPEPDLPVDARGEVDVPRNPG